VQRRAMQSSDELSVPRKASLIDGASDSEEEDQTPMKQSEREDDAQEADEVSLLMVPFSCALACSNSGVSQGDTRLVEQRIQLCAVRLLACHHVLCLAGNSATKLPDMLPVDVEMPLHCSVLPVPVGCASFAPLNSCFVCSRVKLHLRAVCCQQRARAKASRRLLVSKAASPGLLLTLFQQEMMTRRMCCKTTNSLMTVIWRTDRAVFSV